MFSTSQGWRSQLALCTTILRTPPAIKQITGSAALKDGGPETELRVAFRVLSVERQASGALAQLICVYIWLVSQLL
jgi:hypothetical protein